MSGADVGTPAPDGDPDGAAQRWADAERYARRSPGARGWPGRGLPGDDPWPAADKRRARGRVVLVLMAGGVVVTVVGYLLVNHTDRGDDASATGGDWMGLVLPIVGLLMALGGTVAAIRTRASSWASWSALKPLRRAERRSVQRQVQGRERVDPSRLLVLRAVAGAQRAQWPFVVLSCGVILLYVGPLVSDPSPLWISLMGGALACMVVGMSLTAWQAVRAGRFLRDHPEPEAHSTEP